MNSKLAAPQGSRIRAPPGMSRQRPVPHRLPCPAAPQRRVRAAGWQEDLINSFTVAVKNSPLNEGKKALALAQAGDYDAAKVKGMIDEVTAQNAVVVFSFSRCPFCVKAKGLLDELKTPYKAFELDQMDKEGLAIRAELAKMTGRTSMPNVFIGGTSVGGCNDGPGVLPLHKEGKLVPMLREAKALPA